MTLDEVKDKFDSLLDRFVKLESGLEDKLSMENEQLKVALSSQIPLEYEWYPILSEARILRTVTKNSMDNIYHSGISEHLNNSYRKRTITEAKELSRSSNEYMDWSRMNDEMIDLYDDIKSIIEIIQSRRYVLNNITNAFVASVHNNSI